MVALGAATAALVTVPQAISATGHTDIAPKPQAETSDYAANVANAVQARRDRPFGAAA
jgi:hypothetical protein